MNRFLPAVLAGSALACCLASVSFAQVATWRGNGDSGGFLNIVGPGQDGVLNDEETILAEAGTYPPHVMDQLSMYGNLVHAAPGLTEDRISQFFKDASFGVKPGDVDRTYSPTSGVTIIRDKSFGVPHIYGATRYATMFGEGYATAEDRLFLMDLLRHVGRARMAEFLGPSDANLQMDRETLEVAPYQESDLTAQLDKIRTGTPEGAGLAMDLSAYIDGINQYVSEARIDATKRPAEYDALQIVLDDFVPEDVVSIASLVGGIFGKGGGGELLNHCGLKRMAAELGSAATARQVFDDFHFSDDPEAPTTSRTPTPYMQDLGPVDPSANPDIDCSSLQPIDPQGTPVEEMLEDLQDGLGSLMLGAGKMSNAMLISGEHTRDGRPIAVFGPQTGYYMPQLLVEKDVHGPGIDARGVAFAGTDLFVELGRGRNYAWSATSAGGDNIDQFVLKLCEPGGGAATTASMGYLRSGTCEPIETFQHVQITKPSAGGVPGGPQIVYSWRVDRTKYYGPLIARGTLVDGTPIAVASLRSTYQNELGSAVGFSKINDPDVMAAGYPAFRDAMGSSVGYTFNWFYIDASNIAYQHSCLCPKRAQGVDPYLPVWGDGRFDWRGFLSLAEQPSALNPPEGFLTSWNNKQAPGFRANDREFSYGPTYRSRLFDVRVKPLVDAGGAVRTDMIDAMEDAGTCDLRGQDVLPLLLEVLGPLAPVGADPRDQEMHDRLAGWLDHQTHRRDYDGDGQYDDPQSPAIMDAWWPRLSRAIFDTESGHAFDNLALSIDDANRTQHIGSAFQDGSYSIVIKDLRQALGIPVAGSLSRIYCGGGDLQACREVLWQSMSDAAADLETEFGDPTVANWKRQIADEDIRHVAAGVVTVPAIEWVNRPTFQQVVQTGDLDALACYRARTAAGSTPAPAASLAITGPLGATTLGVGEVASVCNAATIDGAAPQNTGAHLACSKARVAPGAALQKPATAMLRSRFGAGEVSLSPASALCVPATVAGETAAGPQNAVECFRAKFTGDIDPRTLVDVSDPAGDRNMRIVSLDSICMPASTPQTAIVDSHSAVACYRASRAPGQDRFSRSDVTVADEIGSTTDTLLRDDRVCVPAGVSFE
jgi:acyl-homoserine lactone acylase PvdQ